MDIKEYLPFYLGQQCQTDDGKIGRFSGFDICTTDYSIVMITVKFDEDDDEDFAVYNDNEKCDRIKLILRELSSMTEEECKDLDWAFKFGQVRINHKPENLNGREIIYLLSKGFDLFGLIENNLAIKK